MTIRKYIPDFITSMNLLSGVVGVVFALEGRIGVAFPLMLAAAVFDFCDGLAARLLHAYSDLGKELDSLSDLVSFGVLPSVMLFSLMKSCSLAGSILCWTPLMVAVFSGLRLAKFNVDERQHTSFIGLPTPASAMICGSLCYFVAFEPASVLATACYSPVTVPVLSAVLCALLVCPLPMFSLKFSKEDSRETISKRIAFLVCCILCAVFTLALGCCWALVILLSLVVYVLLNVVFAIVAR